LQSLLLKSLLYIRLWIFSYRVIRKTN